MTETPLFSVSNLVKHFPIRSGLLQREVARVQAVDDISFDLFARETLGMVGESGCGKSTTAKLVVRLLDPDHGEMKLDGVQLSHGRAWDKEFRRRVQMVFQNSFSSLNPRMPISASIAFAPTVHGASRETAMRRAMELLEVVGLDPALYASRYPHELSGGQRQRVNIARALAVKPDLVILDEAVSALDKSVEAQVLNLLADLRRDFGLTYLFISHDLNVIKYLSDRVVVMYLGKIVESGPVDSVYGAPMHPYTRALLASMPSVTPGVKTEVAPLTGDPPNPIAPPSGCRFRTRCPFAEPVCGTREPPLLGAADSRVAVDAKEAHLAACLMYQPDSGHSRAGETPAVVERTHA
jgi:peptide/nickel transport system ATP-binding protein